MARLACPLRVKSGHLVTTFFVLCNELFLQRSSLWINAVARAFLISTEGGELQRCYGFEHYRRSRLLAKTRRGSTHSAEQMAEVRTKSLRLGIAASYEKIAKWAEQRRDEPR